MTREQTHHCFAHVVKRRAEPEEYLRAHTLTFSDQAEQDVLGADVVVPQLEGFPQRELEHLLGARRERDVAGRCRTTVANHLVDVFARLLKRDIQRCKRLRGDALALVDQSEQDVLGPDVVVIQQTRLFLREDDDAPGAVGESFEHGSSVAPRAPRRSRISSGGVDSSFLRPRGEPPVRLLVGERPLVEA